MSELYHVTCYAHENATEWREGLTATEAIDYADQFVASHALGAAHIVAENSIAGIYIARPSDLQRTTRDERIALLEVIPFN